MKFYDCKIRLDGSLANEVLRKGVSAPELILLRGMHGHDAVVDIEEINEAPVVHSTERARLLAEYKSENALKVFDKLFGMGEHVPLPTEVEGVPGTAKGKRVRAPSPANTVVD
jgi:hypothetical protein